MRSKTIIIAVAAAGILAVLSACAAIQKGPVGNTAVPQPAKAVEIERYLGRWYELARYEQSFQKDCEEVTADYTLTAPGKIKVVNSCRKGGASGPLSVANGKAKIVAGGNNAKLKVSFFGPFYGDYWVMDHSDDYSWAIVGEPSGRYLWLLSREARPGDAALNTVITRAAMMGYNTKMLRITKQS